MDDQWFYAQNGQQVGPVPMQSLAALAASGQLLPEDLVWREGLGNWLEARQVPDIFPVGTVMPLNYQRPAFVHEFVYAGFWLRFVAAFLDGILMRIVTAILQGILITSVRHAPGSANEVVTVLSSIAGIVIGWLYEALMESSNWQATLGKRLLGLKVTDLAGERITFGRASGRHFAKYISAIILLIGYLMAGWTQRKQALHDMIAGTLVIRR